MLHYQPYARDNFEWVCVVWWAKISQEKSISLNEYSGLRNNWQSHQWGSDNLYNVMNNVCGAWYTSNNGATRNVLSIVNVSHIYMETTGPSCSASQQHMTDGHLEGRQTRYGVLDVNNNNLVEATDHID